MKQDSTSSSVKLTQEQKHLIYHFQMPGISIWKWDTRVEKNLIKKGLIKKNKDNTISLTRRGRSIKL